MNYLFLISFRNFIRQKRRNILFAIAIAFGIMILTVFNSFAKGLSDTLLNRVIVYMSGHIKVNVVEDGRFMNPIIRDKEKTLKIVRDNVAGIKDIHEDIGAFGRAVGNGKGDYGMVIGVKLNEDFKSQYRILSGSFDAFENSKYVNPVIVSEQKAKRLKVEIGDQIRMRFSNVNGQNETAILTLVAVVKSQNIFMDYAMYLPLSDMKSIMGYKPYETGALKLILKEPKTAAEKADILYKKLEPDTAYISGELFGKYPVCILCIDKKASENIVNKYLGFVDNENKKEGAILSKSLAKKLKLNFGDNIQFSYEQKYNKNKEVHETKIDNIVDYDELDISENVIFMRNDEFFRLYKYFLPLNSKPMSDYVSYSEDSDFWQIMATEWFLLERTRTTREMYKKMQGMLKSKRKEPLMDVGSMYENASEVIKFEAVFNLITLLAAAVIFIIIMIGFLNSLRMTIRDRTREIGTVRAIGMKQNDVKYIFILEVVYLVVVGWIVGLVLSFIVMKLLSLITFGADNPFNMFMVDRHLYFITTIGNLVKNLVIVIVFALVTAYFPARQAAKLKPAEALSHFH